jgi:diguanylate cyclase (GGDEF)-like protein
LGESPNILLIEDDEDDYLLAHDLLSEVFGNQLRFEWANNWQAGLEAISSRKHDVCLIDYRLGQRSGLDIIRDAVEQGSSIPFILLTGQDDREIDLEAMEAGATDYLVKGQISAPLLDRAIRYSIEQKKVETRLANMARYDELTGLANRTLFRSHLVDCISQTKRNGKVGALLLLDLDNFKDINDSLGHPAGDLLLKEVSVRLAEGVRESDFVARLGGDEFAVIATNLNDTGGASVLARKIIEEMVDPVNIDDWDVFTSTSIGITMFPQDSADPDQLLKNADMALYHAKNNGRGKFQFYNAELNARAQKRKEMEADLRQTLEEGGFSLHFQPKVNLLDGRVVGVETLLRWPHPEQGMIPPDEFIPVAEVTGLIVPIGDWVLRAACAQHAAWRDEGLPPIPVAVNLSAVQFKSPGLMDVVVQALGDWNIEPTDLELEITESMIMDNLDLTTEMLHRLHGLGVRLAIDDFGTGHSSLAYLKRFPMDCLKIDRSFVRDIVDDPDDAAIATTIVTLAKHLRLGVVAEGVETESQLEILRRQGCEEAQGYFYSRPLPPKDFADWYRDYQRRIEVQPKTISMIRRAAAGP